MKRYDSYKDSGTIWFDDVPEKWIVTKIKYFCYKVVNGATPSTNNPLYWEGNIPWIPSGMCHDCEITEADKFITEEGFRNSSTKLVPANTTLVALTGATCSKTGYLLFESCTNQSIAALINRKGIFSKYFFYLLQTLRPQLLTYQTGGAQAGVNVGNCKNLTGLFPSYEEQEAICMFLDSKCGEVDKVISTQEKRIALLQELKQSIITHAVTKGLNPNVKMKDSGIEWIGEVPEHWKVCKIKRLSVVKRGASPRPIDNPIYFDDNGQYAWVRIADVTDSKKFLYSTTQKLSKLGASLSVKMHPGEIFLSIAGTVGKPIITKIDCCIHDGFVWFPNIKLKPEFLYYIFMSGRPYLGLGKLGTQLNLNTETVGYISIPIPEEIEIIDIVSYLDKRCASIDTSISKAQREIELLQEYKQSLITEVVTGKRKVC